MTTDKWYCYALLDPRKPGSFRYDSKTAFQYEPFYIGCGHGARMNSHVKVAFRRCGAGYLDQTRKAKKIRKLIRDGYEVICVRTVNSGSASLVKERERELIALIGRLDFAQGPLTNLTAGGDGLLDPSPETRRKMSSARKGKSLSEETKAKLRAIRSTPEFRARMSALRTGVKQPNISRAKLGVPNPKLSLTMKGVPKAPFTEEHRQNISLARRGKKFSPEHCAAMSLARIGKGQPHSEETKAKMRKPKSPEAIANMTKARNMREVK